VGMPLQGSTFLQALLCTAINDSATLLTLTLAINSVQTLKASNQLVQHVTMNSVATLMVSRNTEGLESVRVERIVRR
jgi:hypothetical protein